MSVTPEQKQEKLLALMDPESFTTKDFIAHFKNVLEFVKNLRQSNKEDFDAINKTVAAVLNRTKSDVGDTLADFKTRASYLFMEKRIKAVEDSHKAHVTQTIGQMADFKGDVMSEIADVKFDQQNHRQEVMQKFDSLGDIPSQTRLIAEEINSLPKLLEMEAIKGLLEELKRLEKLITNKVVGGYAGGFAGAGRGLVKAYDLSSKLDGVTTTFSLPAFWRVISITSSSTPTVFRLDTDYTVDPTLMQITFTNQITPSATLVAGQTLIVVYAET